MKLISRLMILVLLLVIPGTVLAEGTSREQELSVKEKKELINISAQKYGIPPEILKGIAFNENGFMQYKNGEPVVAKDGGIGIMQITDKNLSAEEIEKLKYDTAYNIDTGAKILKEKWTWGSYNTLPKINTYNPLMLEHWYFALMAYNGASSVNDPNKSSSTYQGRVYQTIENNTDYDFIEFPKPEIGYDEGKLKFRKMAYQWDFAYTETMGLLKKGDQVVTRNFGANLRSAPGGTKIASIAPNSAVEILGGPAEDNNIYNFFSWYPVKVNGKQGYLASSTIKKLKIPVANESLTQKEPYGNLHIKQSTPILEKKSDGSFATVATAAAGSKIKVYKIEGLHYNAGGNRYILHDPNKFTFMIGRVEIRKSTPTYMLSNGQLVPSKTYYPRENLRVYNMDSKYFYVGHTHVIKRTEPTMVFNYGLIKANTSTVKVYYPQGGVWRNLKLNETVRVYEILPDRYDVGNGYYVLKSSPVEYTPH